MSSLLRPASVEGTAAAPSAAGPVDRPPRSGLRKFLLGLNVVLAVAVLSVGAGLGYLAIQNNRLHRTSIARRLPGGDGAGAIEPVPKGSPTNILLVGSDSRAFAKTKDDKKQFGANIQGESQRSDTMMIVRLDPKADKATVLSIARDLWVDLDGGGKGRINEAFQDKKDATKSDPTRLIRTISSNFGIPINHYVEVDFGGFRQVVDAIGGVNVYFPFPARDDYSLLDIREAGCVQLDGKQALAYVRARHYQYQENGRWKFDGTGDIGRIQRQQDFMRRVLAKAVHDGLTNPVKGFKLIEAGIDNVTVDSYFKLPDIKDLANQMRGIGDGGLATSALTGDPASIGGADVLRYNPATAASVLAAFGARNGAGGASPTPSGVPLKVPAGTSLQLYNGSGTPGVVASAQADLQRLGLAAANAGNGTSAATTEVRYRTGSETTARAVQAYLGGPSTLVVDRTVKPGQVVVLLGKSFTAVVDPANPSATPATTAPSGTPPPTVPPKGSDPSVAC